MSLRSSSVSLRVEHLEERSVPDATPLDLTTRGSNGWVNDAYFAQFDAQPTGTGAIQSFVRIQGAAAKGPTQQGYNTDARPLQFDENKSPNFTRSLKTSDLPSVNIGGRQYREFLLDINQKSSQPLLSLDQLRVYVGSVGNLQGYNTATGTLAGLSPVYDLDANGDHWVKLNYRLNPGSGGGDMLFYVPEAAFAGGGDYVYLYSKFGEHYAGNAGFQEWARGTGGAPVTSTGSISGTVFFNAGVNLTQVLVYLDANSNGTLDDGEVFMWTETGAYSFNNLVAGAYNVMIQLDTSTYSYSPGISISVLPGAPTTFNLTIGLAGPAT